MLLDAGRGRIDSGDIVEKNVGGIDRYGRIVLGLAAVIVGIAIFAGYWAVGAVVGAIALAIGVILLVTGGAQKCPINQAAGIDTTDR